MRYIKPSDRYQFTTEYCCLDDMIEENNIIRVIDFFVNGLNLLNMGFTKSATKHTGRKPYNPKDILKLYIYGYLNRVNTSRRLETETKRNLEVKWLLGNLQPDFKTIANFRKENKKAMHKVFKEFTLICADAKLLDFRLLAIDGCFFSAVNHNNKNYTQGKIQKVLKHIDKKISDYLSELDSLDNEEVSNKEDLASKIAKLKESQAKYEQLRETMKAEKTKQISLTDPDSRMMTKLLSRNDMSYNVQTAVDSKHSLIANYSVTNACNDLNQLSGMAKTVKESYNLSKLEVTADAGYFNGKELKECHDNDIATYVPNKRNQKASNPDFTYISETDCYQCPMGKLLRNYSRDNSNNVTIYAEPKACKGCSALELCTGKRTGFKRIHKSDYEKYVINQTKVNKMNKDKLNVRKMIVEHPFGTIKHHMKLGNFVTRGLKSVNCEFSLVALAYNFKRAFNILGIEKLKSVIRRYLDIIISNLYQMLYTEAKISEFTYSIVEK